MRQARGFSLIELLIVVAIILVIAAIAVPSYLRARIEADESGAVAALRTLNTAQVTYNTAYPSVGFAATLASLGGTSCNPASSTGACLIDEVLASGTRSGYVFTESGVTGTPNSTYQIFGSPSLWNSSGINYFCSFQDAVVRTSTTTIANCDSTVAPLN